jgi:outer membrane protein
VSLLAVLTFTALSLSDAETKAVARDVGVQQAQTVVMQGAAGLHLAGTLPVPHLLGSYNLSPQAGGGAQSSSSVEQHLLSVGAGVTLNEILSSSDTVRAAADDLLAAQRQAQAAVLAARGNAVRLYYGALSAIALERFRQEELTASLRDRAAAAIRARSGESPHLDVIRADVAVEQARADLALSKAQEADAVEALASATGVDPSALAAVNERPAPPASTLGVDAAVTRALAARPEISSLLASVNAREADVGLARQSGLPLVGAQGGYEGGADTGVPVRGPAVTVNVDFPLSSPEHAQVQIAQAQLAATQWQLIGERRAIALQVAAAVRDARAASQSARAASAARTAATKALGAVELGYREGATASLDVADARRTYVQASVDALVSEYARDEAYALLEELVPQ